MGVEKGAVQVALSVPLITVIHRRHCRQHDVVGLQSEKYNMNLALSILGTTRRTLRRTSDTKEMQRNWNWNSQHAHAHAQLLEILAQSSPHTMSSGSGPVAADCRAALP